VIFSEKKRACEQARVRGHDGENEEKDGHGLRAPAQLKTTLYRESLMLDHPKDIETYRVITSTERDGR
jgi:hypothetical protein